MVAQCRGPPGPSLRAAASRRGPVERPRHRSTREQVHPARGNAAASGRTRRWAEDALTCRERSGREQPRTTARAAAAGAPAGCDTNRRARRPLVVPYVGPAGGASDGCSIPPAAEATGELAEQVTTSNSSPAGAAGPSRRKCRRQPLRPVRRSSPVASRRTPAPRSGRPGRPATGTRSRPAAHECSGRSAGAKSPRSSVDSSGAAWKAPVYDEARCAQCPVRRPSDNGDGHRYGAAVASHQRKQRTWPPTGCACRTSRHPAR